MFCFERLAKKNLTTQHNFYCHSTHFKVGKNASLHLSYMLLFIAVFQKCWNDSNSCTNSCRHFCLKGKPCLVTTLVFFVVILRNGNYFLLLKGGTKHWTSDILSRRFFWMLPKLLIGSIIGPCCSPFTRWEFEAFRSNWLQSYLSDRLIQVCVIDTLTAAPSIISGVPQGSVLGPLLLLVHSGE